MAQETGEQPETGQRHWFTRLRAGLRRTSSRLGSGIGGLFSGGKLDEGTLDALEDLLIMADLGPATAHTVARTLGAERLGRETTADEARRILAERIAAILRPVAKPLLPDPGNKPHVALVVGVNGGGKTTTIGKLAHAYRRQGLSVVMAAGDTFRAAAVEQLELWGARAGAPVVTGAPDADPASVAHAAFAKARETGADLLLVDTAGRLHNKPDLMAELRKVARVIGKQAEGAPHDTILVLDATIGQNALRQVKTFRELTDVSGLVLTKLDGSAKGGVLVSLAETFSIPVHAVGVGEGAEDLQPFDPLVFAQGLVGLEETDVG